jgi:NADH-quinone oxidoreductase subunit G
MAEKNPGFVTCTIDGKEVVAKPGTNIIEAAKTLGIDIPYYCYHKRLSVAANCRMCLVEMSNAPGGKLMPGCQVPVAEGITVKTTTARCEDQRRATQEFFLLNHPVDCAICDQAGECKLQDYTQRYDHAPSRLDMPKVLKEKRVDLGPEVVLDQERCILCTRCVRFMKEIAEEPQLGVMERGNFSFISTFNGQKLDSNYSVNTVDLCPVGALTHKDFRFRGRVWFMSAARSICTGCSRGCNVHLDYLDGVAFRYRPRECAAVNEEWMCDQGRKTYKPFNEARVLEARVGRKGQGERASGRAEAVTAGASALKQHAAKGTLAMLVSPLASLEDALAACLVAKEALSLDELYLGGRPDGGHDDFLKNADENPNRKGIELAAKAFGLHLHPFAELSPAILSGAVKALWAIGVEVPDPAQAPALGRLDACVVQAVNHGPVADLATVLLPASPCAESDGTFVNFQGLAQRFELAWHPRGQAAPHWALCAELSRALGLSYRWSSAREVFGDLGKRIEAGLGDFKWDSLPWEKRRGMKPGGLVPLQAGTVDGRVAGYRERIEGGGEPRGRALPVLPAGGLK